MTSDAYLKGWKAHLEGQPKEELTGDELRGWIESFSYAYTWRETWNDAVARRMLANRDIPR